MSESKQKDENNTEKVRNNMSSETKQQKDEKNTEEVNNKVKVISELASLLEQEKYRQVNIEKFDPKNFVGVFYNDQLMSYNSLSENIRNFRRGDFTENLEVLEGKEAQPEYYTLCLKNNKNPAKVEVVTKDLSIEENVTKLMFANYEEKKVKKIVIKCMNCFEQKECKKHEKKSGNLKEVEQYLLRYNNVPFQNRNDSHEDINKIIANGKFKFIGHSTDNNMMIEGNILFNGGKLWTFYTNETMNERSGYLLWMVECSEDSIEFLTLLEFSHYNSVVDEIINIYQTNDAKSGGRWEDYLVDIETYARDEREQKCSRFMSKTKYLFKTQSVERVRDGEKNRHPQKLTTVTLEQKESMDFILVVGGTLYNITDFHPKILSSSQVQISSNKDEFIIMFDNKKTLYEFMTTYEKFRNDKEELDLRMFLRPSVRYLGEDPMNNKEYLFDMVKIHGGVRTLPHLSEELKTDRSFFLELVQWDGEILQFSSLELRNDRDVVLAAVKQDGHSIIYASQILKTDKEVVLEAVKQDGNSLRHASRELKNDKEVVLAAASQNAESLRYANQEYRKDKDVVLAAVKQNGNSVNYACQKFLKDRDVILEAVKQNGNLLQYASKGLQNDKEVVLEAVKQDGNSLEYANKSLKNAKEVVLAAVQQNGNSLKYASKGLQNVKEVVLAAVKQNGNLLQYASKELQNDKAVVLTAIKQCQESIKFASSELQKNKDVVLEAVRQKGYFLKSGCKNLQNDKEVVLEVVKKNGYYLEYASKELQNDKEVVFAAVKQCQESIKFASSQMQENKDVLLAAVIQDGNLLQYASKGLQNDKAVVLTAVKQNGNSLKYASKELQNDKDVVLPVVKENCYFLKYASQELHNDKEVIMAAVKQYGYYLEYASEELKNDQEIVLEAVTQDGHSFQYAGQKLKNDKDFVLKVENLRKNIQK